MHFAICATTACDYDANFQGFFGLTSDLRQY